MKKIIIIGVILINLFNLVPITIGSYRECYSQDIHFSQFYQTPLIINPALTGVFNGNLRAIINYKDQWRSVTSASPYKTSALSYDMGLFKKKWEKSFLGLGFSACNDRAGVFDWGITQFNLSVSSIVTLNDRQMVSAGLQGGIANRSINSSNLVWGNQYDGNEYDNAIPSGEADNFNASVFSDFSTGVSWSYGKSKTSITANNQFKANAGLALFHINKPNQEFYNYDTEKLYSKLVLHGGAYIGIKNTNINVLPSILFLMQGPSIETNLGGMIRYTLREESRYTGLLKETAVSFGAHYRVGDAVTPSFMFEIANYALAISYDVNISGLRSATTGRGGIEISFRYINPNPFRYGRGTRSTPML